MDLDADFEEGFAETFFGKLHFRHHHGSGKTLLLLHGIGATMQSWRRFIGYMPRELDVYAVDMLGHGLSGKPDIDYTVELQANALKAFTASQQCKKPFVMGHSYGGWVALRYALSNEVGGIILEDAVGLEEYFEDLKRSGNLEQYKDELLGDLLRMNANDERVMRSMLNEQFLKSQLTDESLKRITVPALILWGSDDNILKVAYAEIFHRNIKGSALKIIYGADHVPHYSKASETAESVLGFMRGD